ncbi:MAG: cell division protein FtsZ [Candidatus Staskawiczbacteria bacterium]|nr:cell division protein FtsZ [Candidatus Staskawiczbacteria bacterium]
MGKVKKLKKKIIRRGKTKKLVKTRKILNRKKRNPTKGRKGILTGPSQSRRRRVWSGKKKIVVRKKTVKKIKQVKKVVRRDEGFPVEALFKAKIKVIGVGGGGGSIVSEIGRSLEKATFVVADTDIRALKKKAGIKYFWFGEELTHGLGTGVNVELAKQAAESARGKISGFFKDQDIIIFVASLGGGLGSGATQVFAEAAKEFGGITFGIFTMPFKFEGKNKYRIAQNALKILKQSLNVSLVIPNEKIFKIIDSSTPITNAFSTVNISLIGSLESLIDLIYNPGVINIDFADLRTILRGRGNSAFLNTIEEFGKDRVEKTCENIFKNPLLQNSSFKADKILFDIAGSENLSMFEVQKISSHIANLNPTAKIIFGISKDHKLKNKIKTTILMTGLPSGSQVKEEITKAITVKEIEPVKAVAVKKKKLVPSKKTKEKKSVSFIPVFETSRPSISVSEQKVDIIQNVEKKGLPASRQAIRRSGLEIKEAEELEEKKKVDQEKEWEIPAFLRKVKFKS